MAFDNFYDLAASNFGEKCIDYCEAVQGRCGAVAVAPHVIVDPFNDASMHMTFSVSCEPDTNSDCALKDIDPQLVYDMSSRAFIEATDEFGVSEDVWPSMWEDHSASDRE